MNFKQLEYFSAVAEAGSISGASRELHVAQPPISRQLALLEDELGVTLFLRNNKGIVLTEAGRCIYQQSQQMFQSLRAMADSVRDISAGVRGYLKVGIIYSNVQIATSLLKEYHKRFPQVELYVRMGSPGDLLEDLEQGELHVLFLRSRSERTYGLQELVLGEDPLELVMCPENDPAPGQGQVPIQALRDVPMCLLRSDDLWGYSQDLLKECRRAGFSPNVACHCYDTPMEMQMVQAGFGVGFLPKSIAAAHPGSPVYTKPVLEFSAKSCPILVWKDSPYQEGCVSRFLELAETEPDKERDRA
ncbi:MAG: LysR family transcriptional regulator [Lawsonibacter sp.]|uniref:LysR family transcriptional regulator n=1 Tax=Lawsonibacter sp. JLR.KK007 TaxID=3114293 RepID=UPI00216ED9C6|nr:LysR family transcriptional regulator [Lawsonibacter sp.]MCI8990055.1 LysR family transcriptional regulator [Lawsonibacter sp.]MCI9268237.1 LysR family transcriptional regulator [Lawsonibacter sp.]